MNHNTSSETRTP